MVPWSAALGANLSLGVFPCEDWQGVLIFLKIGGKGSPLVSRLKRPRSQTYFPLLQKVVVLLVTLSSLWRLTSQTT